MGRLAGKVAIITGSASGIGRETAIRMAAAGAHVIGGDLNRPGGEETAAMCSDAGTPGAFATTDVTSEADIAALVDLAVDRFSRVDILINNAGVAGASGPIELTAIEDWDRTQHILLRSVFLGIKHVVPHMKKQKGGSIINVSSLAGHRGYKRIHAYSAAKAGVVNLTRSAAIELGKHFIRVNCICPGDILTPMHGNHMSQAELESQLAGRQPIGRAGRPGDIAGAALYLASDEAEWVTGVSLNVDGGALTGVWTYQQNDFYSRQSKQPFMGPSSEQQAQPS